MQVAWCHGAPGVGLARALGLVVISDSAVLEEIAAAMSTTARTAASRSDHLCCGNMGRSEALLTAGRRLQIEEHVTSAVAIARQVAERARKHGRFALPSTQLELRTFDPGFFQGLSGIGYQLARTVMPARLPSVLGLEAELPGDRGG